MNIELPEHLQATADLLSRSLPAHSRDLAPPVPDGLFSDLGARSGSSVSAPIARVSWMEMALSFVSNPGFGLAAAALVIFGFFTPAMMSTPKSAAPVEGFRGATVVHASRDATIVLITDEPDTRILLEKSGLFEMDYVIETSDPLVAASISTAKLLIDVKGGAMVAYNEESREVLADELPADRSKLAERVALALGALQ